MCVHTYAHNHVWARGEETGVPEWQKAHTCISQKAIPVVLDDPRVWVVEAITTVITALRDFSRWVHIGELRDALRGYNG